MSGIELIDKERHEQIEKHGFTPERDKHYVNGELFQAASFCLELKSIQDSQGRWVSPVKRLFKWPDGWGIKFERKIRNKTRIEQLVIAGAFLRAENQRLEEPRYSDQIKKIAAEIDRLQAES